MCMYTCLSDKIYIKQNVLPNSDMRTSNDLNVRISLYISFAYMRIQKVWKQVLSTYRVLIWKKKSEKIYQWKVVKNPITYWSYKNLSYWLTLIFYNNDDSTKRTKFIYFFLYNFHVSTRGFSSSLFNMYIQLKRNLAPGTKLPHWWQNIFPHSKKSFHLGTSVPAIKITRHFKEVLYNFIMADFR